MSSDNHKTVDDGSGNEISGKPPSSQAECDVGLPLNMQHTHPSKKINLMSHPSPYHNHHPKYHQTSIEFGGGGRQIFEPSSNHIAFVTSPNYTTSGGVIFTASQLQELESQTMIYKHIMSSIPVPPQLLFPLSSQSNRSDSESWRCRRTDGKKWRCSRDVMPDQKYCERHAHKNRARSRKHVETHQSQMQITQSHNSSKHLSSTKDNYNTILPHTPTMSPSCQQSSLLMKNGTIPLSSSNQKIQKPSVGSKGDHFFQNLGGRSSHDHDLVGDNCFLTLMQPGGNDNNNSDDQDDLFQLGFGMLNTDDSNTHNQWTHQGSWLGGPLGEALCLGVASSLNKPSNVTSSLDLSYHGLH